MTSTEHKLGWQALLDKAQAAFRSANFAAAEKLFSEALAVAQDCHGMDCSHRAVILSELAECYEAQGKESQAEDCFKQVREILRKHHANSENKPESA